MFGILRKGDEHRIGNVGVDFGFAGPHHVGDSMRRGSFRRELCLELARPLCALGIAVHERDAVEALVVVYDIDGAPVGKPFHREFGHRH